MERIKNYIREGKGRYYKLLVFRWQRGEGRKTLDNRELEEGVKQRGELSEIKQETVGETIG